MTDQKDIYYWLALLRAPHVGYKTFADITFTFPKLADFFKLKNNCYKELNLHPETITYLANPDWKGAEADLKWLNESASHFILTMMDEEYPKLLREISSPPPILFIKGELAILNSAQIAIVGSRHPSPTGKETAYELANTLAQAGLIVTSGLALGIDTAAHQGALQANKTIAVMGTGINLCYPKNNQRLAEKITQQGALISEFCLDTPPLAPNFPRRNRLISGLTHGTLIVEANLKSGSLITASYALNQGREVFAVPGSIKNPRTKGCHHLIKQGAKLVETAEDVLEELRIESEKTAINQVKTEDIEQKRLDDDHIKLLECVGYEPTKIDVLVGRSNFSIPKVTSLLVDLELAGCVSSLVGGYTRVP